MKVRADGIACVPHITKKLVAIDKFTRLHDKHLHVRIDGLETVVVVQHDIVAKGLTKPCDFDDAIGRSEYRSPAVVADIDAVVHFPYFAGNRMDTRAEGGSVMPLSRADGRDGTPNHLLLVDVIGNRQEGRSIVAELFI